MGKKRRKSAEYSRRRSKCSGMKGLKRVWRDLDRVVSRLISWCSTPRGGFTAASVVVVVVPVPIGCTSLDSLSGLQS